MILRICERWWPEAATFVLWLGALLVLRHMSVCLDVVWQMWVARQLLGGTRLYSQIIEVNPPLWFWIGAGVEWCAQALAISSKTAIVTAVFLSVGAALGILAVLVADRRNSLRAAVLLGSFAALVLIPLPEFGQREHLALIGAVPYFVLIARRADGRPLPWWTAALTGLIAAPGFAFKHYFLIVPLALEIWLISKTWRCWTILRPEIVVLAVCAIVYSGAIIVISPEYFTKIVPLIGLTYADFKAPFYDLLMPSWVSVWIVSALVLWRERGQAWPLTAAAAVTAFGFCACYFIQQANWPYHAIPVTGTLTIALASLLPVRRWACRDWIGGFCLVGILLVNVYPWVRVGPYRSEWAKPAATLLKDSRPGEVAVMLTDHPTKIWPMIVDAGLRWPSRYFGFWMLDGVAAYRERHGTLSRELSKLVDTVRSQTVEDFRCNPPDLMLVDRWAAPHTPSFDILALFTADASFAAFFSHYALERQVGEFLAFRKTDHGQPERPADCRTLY